MANGVNSKKLKRALRQVKQDSQRTGKRKVHNADDRFTNEREAAPYRAPLSRGQDRRQNTYGA